MPSRGSVRTSRGATGATRIVLAGIPKEFVEALSAAGYLAVLIPEQYGGSGLGIGAASAVLEEIHKSGCNGAACHAQMYTMGTLLRHGSDAQKREYLPQIAAGTLRLQAFGVTEPTSGTDTTRIRTTAVRDGDVYRVNGQKVFISRDGALGPDAAARAHDAARAGREARRTACRCSSSICARRSGAGSRSSPLATMMNHATTELFFDNLAVPAANLVGAEGKGFGYILDSMNAERILIASECIGDARWFVAKAAAYAKERQVFGRPIGENQGVQFPIARCHVQTEAAGADGRKAAALFDAGEKCGAEANMAKMLAADASKEAADVCIQTHGGYGFAEEYDIERKFRETRLYQVAPVSTNLILSYVGTHVLGMPKSF